MAEKQYCFEVNIKWVHILSAKNLKKARKAVKDIFRETYNFTPEDKEIIHVKKLSDLDDDLCIESKA